MQLSPTLENKRESLVETLPKAYEVSAEASTGQLSDTSTPATVKDKSQQVSSNGIDSYMSSTHRLTAND
jgi:hypothetical protein